MQQLISLFGLFVMVGFAWLLSSNRRKIDLRIVVVGLLLQFALAYLALRTEAGEQFFKGAGVLFTSILACGDAGARFVFGVEFGKKLPEELFAFRVLPTIIFFSALMGLLFHLGVIQYVVRCIGWLMQKTLRTSGAESLSAAANIFVGQTEAPFVVKPYLDRMTKSELMAVMVGGFATVAGSVMAAYVKLGVKPEHLIAASLISAPAALLIAKVLQPEIDTPETAGFIQVKMPKTATNVFDAITTGATDGLKLALNVAAMLIAFLALIQLVNLGLQTINEDWTLSMILGRLFVPFAWLMGIESQDALRVGELIGTKVVANEFLAYVEFQRMVEDGLLTERSRIIATYALCGFANFSSIGIQIGGMGAIAPSRKKDLARLGLRAMIGGTLAAFMTACIAGVLIA
ncbi:MAG: NupC/NupG family nucleoside CNT transporter [Planctomycetes bacterium]|nr:NupC/NupG family nucleoside CNT transporter [Planctomycetota bacterium]